MNVYICLWCLILEKVRKLPPARVYEVTVIISAQLRRNMLFLHLLSGILERMNKN